MNRMLRILEPVMLAAVPLVLFVCAWFQSEYAAAMTLVVVIASFVPFFLRFERKRPGPGEIMPIVVLAAIAAVGRILFAPFPNFKPVSAIVIVSGACFGRQGGFLTGALAALSSNLFFGQGPWTPWQMYAWGLIGYLAGVFAGRGWLEKPWFLYGFGFLSAFLYGFILDSWYIVGFVPGWQLILAAYGAGIPFSLSHAAATVVFLLPIYKPWCRKIRRVQQKYGVALPDQTQP